VSTDPPEEFRISFVRPWLLALALLSVPVLIAAVAAAVTGDPIPLFVLTPPLAVAAVLVLVPILWAVATSRWHVGATGVGGRDNWHVYRRVAWRDVASVTLMPIRGYRFVWVNARTRRKAFWLPLFLTDMAGFRAAVARHADPANPLRRFLEE
jgi:hypothetical protein